VRVVQWSELIAGVSDVRGEIALTFGVFDGVHPGHTALFDLVGRNRGTAAPAVFTFAESPQKELRPSTYPGDVLSPRQKLERLQEHGIEVAIVADFDARFRLMSGTEFLDRLMAGLDVSYAAVGPDFHCGRNMDTDARAVARYFSSRGVRVDIAQAVHHNSSPVSSTRIRQAIAAGDFETVRVLLGGSFVLDLRDVTIETSHREVWVPRSLIGQVIPFSGAFHSTIYTGGTSVEGVAHVDPDGIRLTVVGDGAASDADVHQIEFNARAGTGIEGERDVAYQRGKG
jgi:riboflavin kinase/FMN adenylyltransferase